MKTKKIRVISIIIALILAVTLTSCGGDKAATARNRRDKSNRTTASNRTKTEPPKDDVKITKTEAKSIQTEKYETADFSITIPKGWKVTTGGINIYHSIRIYDPDNPVNQMFILLKADILLHSQAGKEAWQQSYNMGNTQAALCAKAPVLSNPSTEGFYKIFSKYTDFVSDVEPSYSGYTFPTFDNFNVTDSFTATDNLSSYALGDKLLRATFTADGKEGEGMFAASVVDFGSFQISGGNVVNYQLQTADGGCYMAYNVMAITAEKDTFIEWESVLSDCMKTLDYSDSFVNATNQASNEKVAQALQISRNFNQIMDNMMSSWESRNKSQDIMSQKQSDATLGYERVYDIETNEIYKATNGFTDVYDGNRFKQVTDDNMYAEAISGYIEKQ